MSVEVEKVVDMISLFAVLSESERALVVSSGRIRNFAKGAEICKEGDRGTTFYVVGGGHLDVYAGTPPRVVDEIGVGSYFGEMSLLTGQPRTATIKAASDCMLVEFDRRVFMKLFAANLGLIEKITDAVAARNANRTHLTERQGGPQPAREPVPRPVPPPPTPAEKVERDDLLARIRNVFFPR